jgi:hypothetical protein
MTAMYSSSLVAVFLNIQSVKIADLDHHLEGLAEQKVADQDAGLVAPHHAGRELAAPHVAFIDHIVVQKRRRMHELNRGGQLDVAIAGAAGQFGHRQREHGAQPLAAGRDQMIGNFRDHGHIGAGARQNRRIDPLHVRRDKFGETLDRGRLRIFKGDDDGQNLSPVK